MSREELLALRPEEAQELHHTLVDARCAEETADFSSGVLYWLTQHTKTENPQCEDMGVPFLAPFPRKSYFIPLFEAFMKKSRQLYICKSRSMMTSFSAAGYAAWIAQYRQQEVLIQCMSEEIAEHIVDYVSQLWRNQEPWLRARHPLERANATTIQWKGGGEVAGIAAGPDKPRAYHASLYILDEAAFVPEGESCIASVIPSGARIICISTARPGWFAEACLEPAV